MIVRMQFQTTSLVRVDLIDVGAELGLVAAAVARPPPRRDLDVLHLTLALGRDRVMGE